MDLGYGASPITAVELSDRLRAVRADVEVLGLEIDPARVAAARELERPGLSFAVGGFEVPAKRPVEVIRAFNVLRQYDEAAVPDAWAMMTRRLTPTGVLVEGTCDEVGRRSTWVAVTHEGPRSLTISLRLGGLSAPSEIAPRLPKALIHRNVPGEPIHDFLAALDGAWHASAGHAGFGMRQRWLATIGSLSADWPLLSDPRRWRLGEVTVRWDAVAPHTG